MQRGPDKGLQKLGVEYENVKVKIGLKDVGFE